MDAAQAYGDTVAEPDRNPASRSRKTLLHLGFPMFVQSLLTFAVMLVDMMIISAHSPGAAAAVAVARQVLQIAFEMSSMVGIGAVILISHSLGRGDEEQARRVASLAVGANALFGCFIGILLLMATPVLLWFLAMPQDLAGETQLYLSIVAMAMIFNGFATAAMSCLRAFGNGRVIVLVGLVLSILYMGAEYVLVLGAGPIPAMGVQGAALAALLFRVMMALLFGIALLRELGLRGDFRSLKTHVATVRRMLVLSFPSVSDYIGYGFYQLVLLGFVAGFGVESVLSRTYVMIAMSFLVLVIVAISQGNEVLLGYRCGEGRPEHAYRQALRSSVIATAVTMALATLLWLFSEQFLGLFGQEGTVLALSQRLLLLTVFLQPGFAFNTILLQSLRAVGDVRWPVVASISITWGLGLPLAWLLCIHAGLGVEGVWYALIIEETIKAGFMLQRWLRRRWMSHHVVA